MLEAVKKSWRQFEASAPGERFQDRYKRRQQSGCNGFPWRKIFNLLIGMVLMAAGLFMVLFPGPGWLTILFGLGFIAGESKAIARFMDWLEIRFRKIVRRTWHLYRHSSTPARTLAVLLALALAAGSGYAAYILLFGV